MVASNYAKTTKVYKGVTHGVDNMVYKVLSLGETILGIGSRLVAP